MRGDAAGCALLCVGVWVCGCVGVWVCGCVGVCCQCLVVWGLGPSTKAPTTIG